LNLKILKILFFPPPGNVSLSEKALSGLASLGGIGLHPPGGATALTVAGMLTPKNLLSVLYADMSAVS